MSKLLKDFSNISVLMPYKPGNPQRDTIFEWVKDFYKKYLSKAELCLGDCSDELFSRAEAINNAAKKSTKDFFIIADADIIFDPQSILQALDLLEEYAWVVPYSRLHYINEASTAKILATPPLWPINIELDTRVVSPSWITGGLNVIPRKNFEAVEGFDERFRGWGGEDDAFACSVNTICGHYYRIDSDIYHLFHRHVGKGGNPNYDANYKLFFEKYHPAKGNVEAMKKIIAEKSKPF